MRRPSASASPQGRRRPPVSYRAIVAAVRQEILTGRYGPGGRLPTNVSLQRRFATTPVTVQRAVRTLTQEGFVKARHCLGVFVTEHPPHLNHYALLFHYDPGDLEPGGWSHFYAGLANAAAIIQQSENQWLECFYGIDGRTDSAHYRRLIAMVQAHRFAGVIFTSHPHWLVGRPLGELGGLPQVALMSRDPAFRKIPAVELDRGAWFEKAFAYLAARGRKQIAFISKPGSLTASVCPPAWLAAYGLRTRPYWNLVLPLWAAGAERTVELLMRH